MSGLTRPAASNGQTFSSSAVAMAAFSSIVRGPQRRAGVDEAFDHQLREVHLGLRASQKGDLHDTAAVRRRRIVALDVGPAHHVEDHVDAAALVFPALATAT